MKGKKPTYEERKLIERAGLDTYQWLIQKHTSEIIQVVNKDDKNDIAVFDLETFEVIRYTKNKN